jgi:hypothetical protein
MDNWDLKRYEQEKQRFIQRRIHQAPLWSQFTLVFAFSWGAAWLSSWILWRFFSDSHLWLSPLPIRYALAFMVAYACFFVAVGWWINEAKREPESQNTHNDIGDAAIAGDAEGCLIVVGLWLVGLLVSAIFLAVGGAPMLLEAAFEAAFAGVLVRRFTGDRLLGDWKSRLLQNTWKQAVLSLLILISLAAYLQHSVPHATTFAEAIRRLFFSQ